MLFSKYLRNKYRYFHTIYNYNTNLSLLLRLLLLLYGLRCFVQRQNIYFIRYIQPNRHSDATAKSAADDMPSTVRESRPPKFYCHVRAHVFPVHGVAKINIISNSVWRKIFPPIFFFKINGWKCQQRILLYNRSFHFMPSNRFYLKKHRYYSF